MIWRKWKPNRVRQVRVLVIASLFTLIASIFTASIPCEIYNGLDTVNKTVPLASDPVNTTIYVSSIYGNDSNNGTIFAPFKTIERARDEVRTINQNMTGNIVVQLDGGQYYITDTLHFNQSDGGTNEFDVIYKSDPGETAVIDGGVKIPSSSWIPHDGNIWRCQPGIADFRQLYIITENGSNHNTPLPDADELDDIPYGGKPTSLSVMTPAYDGSSDWERRAIRAMEEVPENTFTLDGDGHGYRQSTGFWSDLGQWGAPFAGIIENQPETISAALHYAKDIEFVYHLAWTLRRIHVHTVAEYWGEKRVIMQQPAFQFNRVIGYGTELGSWGDVIQPAWIENAYALLDEPGEWYFDKHTGWLFYWPRSCEPAPNSTGVEFHIPRTEVLMDITGTASNPVNHMRFEGLTFKHAGWLRPNEYGIGFVDVQANQIFNQNEAGRITERSPGSVVVSYAGAIAFERCIFTKLGSAGLDLYVGCQNSTVRGCIFDDISGTAINIGAFNPWILEGSPEVPRNNSINNNYFTNVAVEFKGGHAVWTGYTQFTAIEHNEISGTAYTSLSVGWGHSPMQTISRNNTVRYNHITNYMMEMQDGAAIYTLSLQNGSKFEYNHIHDGAGSGLYPDEQTMNTTWRYNVVYRSGNSLQDHSLGPDRNDPVAIRENLITDNYFDKDPIIDSRRQEPHLSNNVWNITSEPSQEILAIVSSAGLEEAYNDLVPLNSSIRRWSGCLACVYWSDIQDEGAIRFVDPVFFGVMCAWIFTVGIVGVLQVIKRDHGRDSP